MTTTDAAPPAACRDDPHWYKDAIIYQLHVKAFNDSTQRRRGRLRRADGEAGLHREPGRDRHLAAPVLPVPAARRRLRHRRLHRGASRLRHAARLPGLRARGASARPARHHRAGHQPQQRPASVVRRVPLRPRQSQARLVCVERHRPEVCRRADHLHRHRDEQLDLGRRSRSSTTGIGSSATSPT